MVWSMREQVVVADVVWVAVQQETGVEDVAGTDAVNQGVDFQSSQFVDPVDAGAVDCGNVLFSYPVGLTVGHLDLQRRARLLAVVQHMTTGRVSVFFGG